MHNHIWLTSFQAGYERLWGGGNLKSVGDVRAQRLHSAINKKHNDAEVGMTNLILST
jgi:hypothetical protein